MTPTCVLDASALLCYLQDEPGSDRVGEALGEGAAISAINWAEVLSKLADRGENPDAVSRRLSDQGLLGQALAVQPLDETMARDIARLRPLTRPVGLSLADRACVALARKLDVPAITADRAWKSLKLGVRIQILR